MNLNEQLLEVASNAIWRQKGTLADAKRLLDEGADVNTRSENGGLRPIHYAVYQGKGDMLQLFVKRGADINAADEKGMTPLHYAAERGEYGFCTYLLQQGAKHKVFCKDHMAPIHYAAKSKKDECCRRLIQGGADKDLISRYTLRWTPLQFAAMSGDERTFIALLEMGCDPRVGKPPDLPRPYEQAFKFPLHYVASKGTADAALKLLDLGFDPDAKNASRKTPMELAEKHGQPRVASVLSSWRARQAADLALRELGISQGPGF